MSENKEHMVEESAFLVSKTDLKGRITYCNEPFLKIVGAKQAEVLGKPHNIVRHPDMPRAIFKLLWEHIKDKKEIFAYVKNKSLMVDTTGSLQISQPQLMTAITQLVTTQLDASQIQRRLK